MHGELPVQARPATALWVARFRLCAAPLGGRTTHEHVPEEARLQQLPGATTQRIMSYKEENTLGKLLNTRKTSCVCCYGSY